VQNRMVEYFIPIPPGSAALRGIALPLTVQTDGFCRIFHRDESISKNDKELKDHGVSLVCTLE
jgi:hypothetical protein